jgi:pyruvate dehydrogenase E1 component alpha subunit
MKIKNVSDRASAYGIPGFSVDGNDVLAIDQIAKKAIQRARKGEGPALIECKTYRHKGHSRIDPAKYRSPNEVERWLRRDPIVLFRKKLLKLNVLTEDDIRKIEKNVTIEIEKAEKYAIASSHPNPEAALEDVYA